MNEMREIEDSFLFGHNLAQDELSIEKDAMVRFAELDLQTKQVFGFEETQKEREIAYLTSNYKVSEDTIGTIANMESGIFDRMFKGLKNFFKKAWSFVKKLIFFWKKKKPEKKIDVNHLINTITKDPKRYMEVYLQGKFDFDMELKDYESFIMKLLDGDLKVPVKKFKATDIIKKKQDFQNALSKYIPKKRHMILFKKDIEVEYDVIPVNITARNIEAGDKEISYTSLIDTLVVVRDTNGNVLTIVPISFEDEGIAMKDEAISGATSYIKKNVDVFKNAFSNLEKTESLFKKIDKKLSELEKDPENSPLYKSLESLGYSVKVKDVIGIITIAIKTTIKSASKESKSIKLSIDGK